MTVIATGVRELKSKMRGSMDILQLVNFEYVEGREIKRLTGIHEIEKFSITGENVIQKRRVVSNIINFILRTVVGETANEKLWENFLVGMKSISDALSPPFEGGWEDVELLWLIKILVSLGYWEEGNLDSFTQENFEYLKNQDNKKEIIEKINSTIRHTHL
jgi:recombinational DNA repair protein (RecF pathway)